MQVLDPAIPAERKSKPLISLNMLIAGVLALFLGIFLAFFLEYLERMKREINGRTDIRPIEVEKEAKI